MIGWVLLFLALPPLTSHADDKFDKAQKQYEKNVRIASRYPVREFEKAVETGDVNAVMRLLDKGVPVSLQIPTPQEEVEGLPPCEQAIHIAAGRDQLEVVRLLLDRGADPNARNSERSTPLHNTSDLEIAKLLISRGADAAASNDNGWQPIHCATFPSYLEGRRKEAVEKSISLVRFLIRHGADPLAKDKNQEQPIHVAAEHSNAQAVSFFIDRNANVNAAIHGEDGDSENGLQPLHIAAAREDDTDECLEIAELLIRKGADVNGTTADGKTPLHLSKNVAMTKLLLDHGAKVNAMSAGYIKEQPIHHFAMEGDVESLKLLLDRGVDIGATSLSEEQTTALDKAAYWGKTEAVRFLLSRGAKPTERTMKNARRFGGNPIEIVSLLHQHGGIVSAEMFMEFPKDRETLLPLLDQQAKDDIVRQSAEHIADAAEAGNLDRIRDLVSFGAKTDQLWDQLLPIHHAVASGKEEVVGYFLSAGQPIDAKCTVRDEDTTPPMVITDVQPIHCAIGKPELIPFLIKKGAKIDATTGEGWQPIHFAAAFGEAGMLKAVIQAGGDPSAKTHDGKTPLQLAENFKRKENVRYLKDLKPSAPAERTGNKIPATSTR